MLSFPASEELYNLTSFVAFASFCFVSSQGPAAQTCQRWLARQFQFQAGYGILTRPETGQTASMPLFNVRWECHHSVRCSQLTHIARWAASWFRPCPPSCRGCPRTTSVGSRALSGLAHLPFRFRVCSGRRVGSAGPRTQRLSFWSPWWWPRQRGVWPAGGQWSASRAPSAAAGTRRAAGEAVAWTPAVAAPSAWKCKVRPRSAFL